jgi:hypothetical protein
MIKGLRPAAIAIIDRLQPIKPGYATDPLYQLNELWNSDKHRLLNFASIRINAFKQSYIYPPGLYREGGPFGPFAASEDGTELCRFRPPADLTPEVKVMDQIDYTGPFFRETGPTMDHEIRELLPQLIQTVESITDELIATVP